MRIDSNGNMVLSRRNLKELLRELDEGTGNAYISRRFEDGTHLCVTAEEDTVHYPLLKQPIDLSRNSFKE